MPLAYKTGRFALELYYFTEENMISYSHVKREFTDSFDTYKEAYKNLKNTYLLKKHSIQQELDQLFRIIRNLHFGNRFAAMNRCILCSIVLWISYARQCFAVCFRLASCNDFYVFYWNGGWRDC